MQAGGLFRTFIGSALGTIVAALTIGAPAAALASQSPPDLCRTAAREASDETGIPYDVLMAIALTETGQQRDGMLEPWAWAVHHDGKGHWFPTKAEAVALAETALQAGATNIDLGCFQLNIRWHAGAFGSADDMLEPAQNARYAARFLADLFQESGDWTAAAGAYHSRDPDNAEAYRQKFATILAGLQNGATAPDLVASQDVSMTPRDNRFPLLKTGAPGGIGSLVPQFSAAQPLVGG
jgi:Transglycosylase SLT domain